jgi:hypothetical protein
MTRALRGTVAVVAVAVAAWFIVLPADLPSVLPTDINGCFGLNSENDNQPIQNALVRLDQLLQSADMPEATMLTALIERCRPRDTLAHIAMGAGYNEVDQWPETARLLGRAITLAPDEVNVEFRLVHSNALWLTGRYDDSIKAGFAALDRAASTGELIAHAAAPLVLRLARLRHTDEARDLLSHTQLARAVARQGQEQQQQQHQALNWMWPAAEALVLDLEEGRVSEADESYRIAAVRGGSGSALMDHARQPFAREVFRAREGRREKMTTTMDYTTAEQAERWMRTASDGDVSGGWAKVRDGTTTSGGGGSGGVCDLDRRSITNLSREEFIADYVQQGRPVVIDGLLDAWPARSAWTRGALERAIVGDTTVPVAHSRDVHREQQGVAASTGSETSTAMPLREYFTLMQQGGEKEDDGQQLYLFTKQARPLGANLSESADLTFGGLLGEEGMFSWDAGLREENVLSFVGAEGSSTAFHHHSAAFNALVFGRKRWFLLPPAALSGDARSGDWALDPVAAFADLPVRPLECEQAAGEIVFVPESWQHAVVNVDSVAAVGIAVEVGKWVGDAF